MNIKRVIEIEELKGDKDRIIPINVTNFTTVVEKDGRGRSIFFCTLFCDSEMRFLFDLIKESFLEKLPLTLFEYGYTVVDPYSKQQAP